jgi:glycosyltransferase involved in cell wall biosynthesis
MRILQVYKDVHPFTRGGIERYIHDLSVYLSSRGHDVDVLVARDGIGNADRGVTGFNIRTYRCCCRILSNPISSDLNGILRSTPADVIHFHLPLPAAVAAWTISRRRTPYIVTYHSDIVRQAIFLPFYAPLLKRFLRRASCVIATSPVYRDSSRYLSALPNVRVVPIGSDPGLFKPPAETAVRDFYLFVGRFRLYKGIQVLLDAWSHLSEQKLIMVGGGPLEDMVRDRIRTENLNIEIVSDPDDQALVRLYQQARCLILPSTKRSEAFGMVQTEAMACGTPVISTDIPTGVPWVNMDNVSGLVIPSEDPSSLMEAVIKMQDDSLHEKLSDGALERAKACFSAAELFSQVESILENAVNAKNP